MRAGELQGTLPTEIFSMSLASESVKGNFRFGTFKPPCCIYEVRSDIFG